MGSCCNSSLKNADEISMTAKQDDEGASHSNINKKSNLLQQQTFGVAHREEVQEDDDSKEQYGSSEALKAEPVEAASPSAVQPLLESRKQLKIGIDLFVQLKKGTIADFYEQGEVLGEGAYGKVWKVTHKTTKMVRAMKSLKKTSILKEEQERMFSEMNLLKNLDHPHIVKLFELFQDSKNYYLITEHCSGGELFDRIKQMSYFTEKKAADLMKQILSAVVYCHRQNIVHRDLKPENLLFVSKHIDSKIKVIDFGTSRKFDPTKRMTKRLGTPYYIAPEVLLENYNEKCDVWSCGVILYILLCGYPPFSGRSEDEILAKVKSGKFRFDPEDWDHISQEAKDLITRMLTLNPAKRPTAESAYNDQWIQKFAPNNDINSKCLQNLQQFHARSKFKQALLTFIATQILSQQEQEELQKTFQALDSDGDGMLSRDELIAGYTKVLSNREQAIQEVDKIIEFVDINKSGQVDFTEFLIAAMNQEKLLSIQKMQQAFDIIDLDHDEHISKEELEYVMGDIDDEIWQDILKEVDSDSDGKISRQEFIELLMSKVL